MIANYHTHTPLCRHAEGELEDFVSCAINRGLQIFGFSDHAPHWFCGDYYSHMRMYPQEFPNYCQKVRQLADEYKGHIQIPLGLEVEYYPELFPRLLQEARDQGVEYFLLGQHWIGNEEGEPYCGAPHNDETILARYCAQVADGMQTGLFSYLAHPDLIHYLGDPKIYEKHIRWLCREANANNIPLELNFLGMLTQRHYPNEAFWNIAAEENCKVVFGLDAHSPEEVAEVQVERSARRFADKLGLQVLETVPLRRIG